MFGTMWGGCSKSLSEATGGGGAEKRGDEAAREGKDVIGCPMP